MRVQPKQWIDEQPTSAGPTGMLLVAATSADVEPGFPGVDPDNPVHRLHAQLADRLYDRPRKGWAGLVGPLVVAPAVVLGALFIAPAALAMALATRATSFASGKRFSRARPPSTRLVLKVLNDAACHAVLAAARKTS